MLSAIIFAPLAGAIFMALVVRQDRAARYIAALFALVSLILAVVVTAGFDMSSSGIQFREEYNWIPALNVKYFLGVDGLSLPMVILTTLLGFLAALVSWKVSLRPREYFIWLLVLETGILGVFTSLDLILFFLFWEVELVPMYLLISIWGSGRKEYSAMKFVVYTLVGSAFMLVGILALYFTAQPHTFDMLALAGQQLRAALVPLPVIFLLILAAFAIKLPVFPFHTWLPDAHTDAPTAVSVILAGVLLKMGGYAMIRISVSIFPDVARTYAPWLVALAVVNVLYGAAVTLRQTDMKKLIAYSSVSHMGYVLLGVFALTQVSLTGATLQMFSHGLITGLLFAMVGLVYDKTHVRHIPSMGGLVRQMPIAATVFSIAGLASLGLPATSGFAAEFLVFLGSYTSTAVAGIQVYTVLGVLGIVVTAGYILWMLQRVFFGPVMERYDGTPDADRMELFTISVFVAGILLVGIYPALLTDLINLGIMPILGRLA